MLREHLETIQRVCFAPTPSDADLAALGAPERWATYRRMVRARLVEVIHAALPRTLAAMGEETLSELIARWLAQRAPRTRYFYDVPAEFVEFVLPMFQKDPRPWVEDLARYEIARWAAKHGPSEQAPVTAFSFDHPPVMNPTLAVLRLSYPVHEKPTPADGYAPKETLLCVYRDGNHKPVTWTLNPMAADLVEAWTVGNESVAESVQAVAAARRSAITENYIEKLSEMIADFIDRGILLGSRA